MPGARLPGCPAAELPGGVLVNSLGRYLAEPCGDLGQFLGLMFGDCPGKSRKVLQDLGDSWGNPWAIAWENASGNHANCFAWFPGSLAARRPTCWAAQTCLAARRPTRTLVAHLGCCWVNAPGSSLGNRANPSGDLGQIPGAILSECLGKSCTTLGGSWPNPVAFVGRLLREVV